MRRRSLSILPLAFCTLFFSTIPFAHAFGRGRTETTTLNLSQDLVRLGIAAKNMVPNQPALDAGPLFLQGVQYANSHGIGLVVADPGAYYFLSEQQQFTSVPINQLSNLTIDFQGADLYFAAVNTGFQFNGCSNLIVENFYTVNSTADTDDGVCDVTNCTLREAINAASNSGADTIGFSVSGTIQLGSSLPTITDAHDFRDSRKWALTLEC